MASEWWVFRLTRRWDFISITYVGVPPESWLDDLKAEFGHYAIYDSPRIIDLRTSP